MRRNSLRALAGLSGILLIALLGCGNSTVTIVQGGATATGNSGSGTHATATGTHSTSHPTATATHSTAHPTATPTHTPAPPYFVQTASSTNRAGDYTIIDNALTNGNPNAILIVTPNWNPSGSSGVYDDHPIGVYYTSGKWAIFNQDTTQIPLGAAFNVWVVPASAHPFQWTATSGSLGGDYTVINHSGVNGDSSAWLLVTPNWSIPGGGGVYDNHPIGVFYTSGQWAIYNQDRAAIPVGAGFNVVNVETVGGFLATATPANSISDYTTLPPSLTSGSSHALIFITANWNPGGGTSDVYNDHNTGVWYTSGQWAIFNQDRSGIPNGAAFNTTTLGG